MEPIDSAKTQNTQNNQIPDKQISPQPILEKEIDERLKPLYHKLDDFLDSLSNEHLKIVWGFVTDNDSLFYLSEFPRDDLKKEIYEQIEMCKKMNIEEFQTEETIMDWIWDELYKRACKYSISRYHFNGLKWWLYDNCFIQAIAPQIKNFELLDKLRYELRYTQYVNSTTVSRLCEVYNLAIRTRIINQTTNMIEFSNKENDGWYGDPNTAKIKCETCYVDNHMMIWMEDVGITSFYMDHMEEVDKYAEKHNWTDKKKYHAIKIRNGRVEADEKAKGMNTLRFLEKLKEKELLKPLIRGDEDVLQFVNAQNEIYGKIKVIKKGKLTEQQKQDMELGIHY